MVYKSSSVGETMDAGEDFAKKIAGMNAGIVALYGDLGAGKTCFVKGIAKGFGIAETVNSPTFSIINCYKNGGQQLYHIDAYRLKSAAEILNIGFEDYVSEGICLIEWPEQIEPLISKTAVKVRFTIESETTRTIKVEKA
ncbi:MAG: tRNA (adenosine(37)-N6)-threonylcarbamoyltransferase complex ATPase subunit type 1 TsaE [Fibrobacteres bacterium]|nr:tRNA (adenosine(37)-N6)-threonylcarbamoyltransferase complex ATPase subunit type 1 TsaE [Fibrobacterota bacterium]